MVMAEPLELGSVLEEGGEVSALSQEAVVSMESWGRTFGSAMELVPVRRLASVDCLVSLDRESDLRRLLNTDGMLGDDWNRRMNGRLRWGILQGCGGGGGGSEDGLAELSVAGWWPVSTAASTRLSFSPRLHFTPQSKAQAVSPNAMHPPQTEQSDNHQKKEGAHASRHSSLCGAQALLGASRQTLIQKQASGNGRRRVKTRSQSWAFQQSSAQGDTAHLVLPTSSYRLSKGHSFRSASFPKQAATVVGVHRRGKYEALYAVSFVFAIHSQPVARTPLKDEREAARNLCTVLATWAACTSTLGSMERHPYVHHGSHSEAHPYRGKQILNKQELATSSPVTASSQPVNARCSAFLRELKPKPAP
ncbi:hypothetical protein L1887_51864 [Cichorium endivia]|nr:hypothetical protein L1887_51864 [Cichorium endivia]